MKKSTGSDEVLQWVILHETSARDKLLGLAQFNDDFSAFMLYVECQRFRQMLGRVRLISS